MTTTAAPRPTPAGPPPKRRWREQAAQAGTAARGVLRGGRSELPPEDPRRKAARLHRRRRLVTWSILPVILALLLATKFLTMSAAAREALDGFYALNGDRVSQASDRMAFVNIVERHKAPFARGDFFVVGGDFDQARAQFEAALDLAPPESVDSCQIRTNLALALEKLGDNAKAAGDEAAARGYWQRVIDVRKDAPQGCFEPPADGAGQKTDNAAKRAEAKLNPQQQQQPGGDQLTPQQQAEQDAKGNQLDDKTQENQQQRAEQGPNGQQDPNSGPGGGGGGPSVDKPW